MKINDIRWDKIFVSNSFILIKMKGEKIKEAEVCKRPHRALECPVKF